MRILITGTTANSMPPPYAGVPKLILATARLWREKGHEVAITWRYKPKDADDLNAGATYFFEYGGSDQPNKLQKVGFLLKYFLKNPSLYFSLLESYKSICPHHYDEAYLYAAYGVYLDGIYESWKPDVVLSQAALIKSFMAAELANRRHIPIAFDVYSEVRDFSMGVNRFLSDVERKRYWMGLLGRADLVLGMDNCSVELRAYAREGTLKEFWDTGDYEFFSQPIPETRTQLREYFSLPSDMFLVSAVGSFELRKGHDHLIMAVARLAKQGLNIGAVICGGQGNRQKWRDVAKEAGIAEDRLFFFSNISELELVKLHHTVDVYTNLSNSPRMCGYDLALIEAMSAGLPVVVYDNGALPKVIQGDSTNGYVVPMNDIPAAAEAMKKLYEKTPEERKAMGKISAAFASTIDLRKTTSLKLGWLEELVVHSGK
ncbi:MAG TPA: glycosyltransferase [Candidatus Paceibacterota bacterium]|nr:glycosyltransferase [Candidatus Paceibacterota bacterium]